MRVVERGEARRWDAGRTRGRRTTTTTTTTTTTDQVA
jgi:hypothetical protein